MDKDDVLLVGRSIRVLRFLRSDPVRFRTSLQWANRMGMVGRFALRAVLRVARNEKRIGGKLDTFIQNVLKFSAWKSR